MKELYLMVFGSEVFLEGLYLVSHKAPHDARHKPFQFNLDTFPDSREARLVDSILTHVPHEPLLISGISNIVARLYDRVQEVGHQELCASRQQDGVVG
jgi:hypothetical protein